MLVKRFRLAFPAQQRWSWVGTERALQKVMTDSGMTAVELMARIDEWRKHKVNMTPWELPNPLPRPKPTGPADAGATELPAASEEARRWAEQQSTPYDGEEV
jgi:hypothetical protein